MPRVKKPVSGGARLVAAGRKPVTLGLPAHVYDFLRRAAKEDARPLTQVLVLGGIEWAEKKLGEKLISP